MGSRRSPTRAHAHLTTALPHPRRLRRTNLGALTPGSRVNLERSLSADGRNSGHYVQGHVDGTGRLSVRGIAQWWRKDA